MERTDPQIDQLLKNLKDGNYFERRSAADALGALGSTNRPIIDALMHTLSNDPDPGIKYAAGTALQKPVPTAFISSHPYLSKNLTAALQENQIPEPGLKTQSYGSGIGRIRMRRWGLYLLVLGIGSIVLPVIGRQFIVLSVISGEVMPYFTIGLIAIGIGLLIYTRD